MIWSTEENHPYSTVPLNGDMTTQMVVVVAQEETLSQDEGGHMTVRDIIKKYLEDNGYDGLFYPGDCACLKDDLQPCDGSMMDCEPGYKRPCTCGEGHDYDICAKKGV
jgi:hypothetical protein